jgi:hypothetical protein
MLANTRMSRRSFLVGVAGFSVVPVLHHNQSMSPLPPVRMAFVGLGAVGHEYLAQALGAGVEVLACCDLRQDALRRAFDTLSVSNVDPLVVTDYRDLLRFDGVDAVAVATPIASRSSIVRHAIAARKHVFVQSPYSLDSGDAAKICEDAMREKRLLMHASSLWGWDLDSIVNAFQRRVFGPALHVRALHGSKSPDWRSATDGILDAASVIARLIPEATPTQLTSLPSTIMAGRRVEITYDALGGRPRASICNRRLRVSSPAENFLHVDIQGLVRSWSLTVESRPAEEGSEPSPVAIHSFLNQIRGSKSKEWHNRSREALDLCRVAIAMHASTAEGRTVNVAESARVSRRAV